MPQHVVVTGGAGFIGSHLVDALLGEGRTVTVVDRLSTGGSMLNLERHVDDPAFSFVLGDVNDDARVGQVLAGADAVIHAAAESHVDRSIDGARGFLESNVLGTQTVLEAVRTAGVRMLLLSTDEVYGAGDPAGGLFDEDARCGRARRTRPARPLPTCCARPTSRPTGRTSPSFAARTPTALGRSNA